MTGDIGSGGSDPRSLDRALADLTRTVDSLRALVQRREPAERRAAPPTAPGTRPIPDPRPDSPDVVQELLRIPAAGIEPHELFALATERLARLLHADRVMAFAAEGDRLVPRSARGFRRDDLESIVVQAGEGIVGRAFKDRRVIAASARDEDAFLERFPVLEAVAVPVRADDEVVGVLYAGRRSSDAFESHDVLVLLVVADRLGAAVVHHRLLERRAVHVGRLAELADFAGEAPVGRELAEVLSRACEVACRVVRVRAAAVAIGVEELEVIAARGLPRAAETSRSVSRREGLTAELYASAAPVACRDLHARRGAERSFLGDAGFRACLLVPLRVRGLALGVLYLADAEVRDFSSEEIAVTRVLAAMAAAAVENGRVHAIQVAAVERARSGHGQDVEAEKARLLTGVANGIAREFNQIFAVILGKSQLMLARSPDDAIREGLAMIEEAAWRGADVVRRIGGLAAPAGETALDIVDLKALVQDAVALARTRWRDEAEGQGRVEITADLEPVAAVRGDEWALRETVGHIVRNALDAMPTGGRLTLGLRARDGGVELIVEDTGEGLTDEVRRRMFDPFFTTRAPGRMGLGLTLVRNAIARCGGRVTVTSASGHGTVVTVWVPSAEGSSPAPPAGAGNAVHAEGANGSAAASSAAPATHPAKAHACILVLEDEDAVREALVGALTGAGHEVHSAADGAAGLEQIESGRFDVVLADLALPQRSGLVVARSVKRVSPRTPVILITGWGHLLDPERLRQHGVDLMLVKPFRAERVVSVVNDALRLHA